MRTRAFALRAVPAVIGAMVATSILTPKAESGGAFCLTCIDFLMFCCPKPCPVVDPLREAKEVLKRILLDTEENAQDMARLGFDRLAGALGAQGPLPVAAANTPWKHPDPAATAGDPRTAPSGYEPGATGRRPVAALQHTSAVPYRGGPPDAAREAAAAAGDHEPQPADKLNALQQTTIADADLAIEELTLARAHADEMGAQASDVAANARDMRDYLRALTELEAAIAYQQSVANAARTLTERLRMTRLLRRPQSVDTDPGQAPVIFIDPAQPDDASGRSQFLNWQHPDGARGRPGATR